MVKIGIIGGSGLDDLKLVSDYKEIEVATKFGKPSSLLTLGKINNIDVVILARHGRGHKISPSNVNYKANIQAFKDQGVTHILTTTACGSLKEHIGRGDLIILDQFIDYTKNRNSTFHEDFSDGIKHTSMPHPFNESLRRVLIDTSRELNFKSHEKGTVITIEDPRFSTKAESRLFRSWGANVINMSSVPEANLVNEAGMCYASIAMATDYDCFLDDRKPVTYEEVMRVMEDNVEKVKKLLINTLPKIN